MRIRKLTKEYIELVNTKHVQLKIEFPEYGLVNIPKFPETFWELNTTKCKIIAQLKNHKIKIQTLNHFRTIKSRLVVRLKKLFVPAFVQLKKLKLCL